jgi:hypothetical protein
VFGYTLRYPSAWAASSATPEQGCGYFDTAPVSRMQLLQASRHGRLARAAIRIYPYGTSYGRAVIAIHNRSDMNANNTIDLGVGNTYGERILGKVTTAGSTTTRMFLYLFSVRGKAFVADAYQPYSRDFGETMRVLDQMMHSLHVQ